MKIFETLRKISKCREIVMGWYTRWRIMIAINNYTGLWIHILEQMSIRQQMRQVLSEQGEYPNDG